MLPDGCFGPDGCYGPARVRSSKNNPLDVGFNINMRTYVSTGGVVNTNSGKSGVDVGLLVGGILGAVSNIAGAFVVAGAIKHSGQAAQSNSVFLPNGNIYLPQYGGGSSSIFGDGLYNDSGHFVGPMGGSASQTVQQGQSGQSAQTAQSGQSGQSAQSAKSGQSGQSAQSAQSGQSGQSAQSAQSGQSGQSAQSAQSGQSGQSAQSAQSAQSGQSAQTAQSGQSGQGVHKKISASEFNEFVNGSGWGRIVGTNSEDISNKPGYDNVIAGKANKTNHSVTTSQDKAKNGYLASFTIKDSSGNIYTLTDPQVDETNGKLTYKIDIENSDLSADDKDGAKNYEVNPEYNKDTRLEVQMIDGQLVLLNESGQPIARQ